jgi:hypothetical protein
MKFSTLVVSMAIGSVSGFAPSRASSRAYGIFSSTLEEKVEPEASVAAPAEKAKAAVVDGAVPMGDVENMDVAVPLPTTIDKSRIQV